MVYDRNTKNVLVWGPLSLTQLDDTMLTKCYFLPFILSSMNVWTRSVWESIAQARQHCDNSDFPCLFLFISSFVTPFCDYRIYNVGAETLNNVFIEPIHLLTHNSQPTLDMSNINIHEIDWVLLLWWIYSIINLLIFTAILFSLKAIWIHTNSFLWRVRKEWPLWILNSIRLPRPLHPRCVRFVAARPLGFPKSKSLWYYIKRTTRECGRHLLVERWGKRQSERQAARCHQCREMGVKRMKTYKWKSIREGRKA